MPTVKHTPNPKTYKIYPFFSKIFDACLDLYARDHFTEPLIKKFFDFKGIEILPVYTRSELFQLMINDYSKKKDLMLDRESIRINELMKAYLEVNEKFDLKREYFNVRIPNKIKEFVNKLSLDTETIGDVIESAIILFINSCDEKTYEVIRFSFISHLHDELIITED